MLKQTISRCLLEYTVTWNMKENQISDSNIEAHASKSISKLFVVVRRTDAFTCLNVI